MSEAITDEEFIEDVVHLISDHDYGRLTDDELIAKLYKLVSREIKPAESGEEEQ